MFKVGDLVVCTFGSNRGVRFIIAAILDDGSYSCSLESKQNNRYYRYTDGTIELV